MNNIDDSVIIDILKQCYDPEIPIDLWNLGLIYKIDIVENSGSKPNVHIIMTLTTPGCTMGQHMADDIKSKIENTNLSIATTGIAGPTGQTKNKPIGLVYVGIKYKKRLYY